jgi:hypothetical protein
MSTQEIIHISDNILYFLSLSVILAFLYRLAKDKNSDGE